MQGKEFSVIEFLIERQSDQTLKTKFRKNSVKMILWQKNNLILGPTSNNKIMKLSEGSKNFKRVLRKSSIKSSP